MIYKTAKVTNEISHGKDFFIGDFCLISCKHLTIGEKSHINAGSLVLGRGSVKIGEYSCVSYNCILLTSTDTPKGIMNDFALEKNRRVKVGDISIGDNVFIGINSIILPGVTIGNNSVIGANSYIDKDIPASTIVIPKQELIFKKRVMD